MLDHLIQRLHTFAWKAAPTRGGGTKAVWTGQGQRRPLYGKRAQAALAGKGAKPDEPKPPAAGSGDLQTQVEGALGDLGYRVPTKPGPGDAGKPVWQKKGGKGPLAAGDLNALGKGGTGPASAVAAAPVAPPPPPVTPPDNLPKGTPPPPPAPPAQMAQIEKYARNDASRFGAKAAEFLRGAAAYALGMLTAANGAAWGAVAGLALAGPLGLGLGTALGGGLGARLGGTVARKGYAVLGGANRARAELRKLGRAAGPVAAGALVGGPLAAAGTLTTGAALGSAAASGVIAADAVAGFPVTNAALEVGQAAVESPVTIARATRRAMATSKVSERKAARRFAEQPANSSAPANLDPVKLLTMRVKAVTGKTPDQKLIMAALAMAALKAGAQLSPAEAGAQPASGFAELARTLGSRPCCCSSPTA